MSEQQKESNNNLMKYMANPRAYTLKRWMLQILQNKFPQHEGTIERVSASMITEGDLQAFGTMVGEIFQLGYLKAVNDYREQFEKLGVKINVSTEPPNP